MFVHRGEGVIVKLRCDLLEARRVPVLVRVGGEVRQNFPLALCKRHRSLSAAGLKKGPVRRSTEHLPKFYVSRRSTEAQAFSVWIPPAGTPREFTDETPAPAATLPGRPDVLRRSAVGPPAGPSFPGALQSTQNRAGAPGESPSP